MQYKCSQCHRRSAILVANSVLYLYLKQPWFSWMRFTCGHCGEASESFFGDDWRTYIRQLGDIGIAIIREDFATESIISQWENVYDKHLIQEQYVSERALHQVEFLAWLLERREDELLASDTDDQKGQA